MRDASERVQETGRLAILVSSNTHHGTPKMNDEEFFFLLLIQELNQGTSIMDCNIWFIFKVYWHQFSMRVQWL